MADDVLAWLQDDTGTVEAPSTEALTKVSERPQWHGAECPITSATPGQDSRVDLASVRAAITQATSAGRKSNETKDPNVEAATTPVDIRWGSQSAVIGDAVDQLRRHRARLALSLAAPFGVDPSTHDDAAALCAGASDGLTRPWFARLRDAGRVPLPPTTHGRCCGDVVASGVAFVYPRATLEVRRLSSLFPELDKALRCEPRSAAWAAFLHRAATSPVDALQQLVGENDAAGNLNELPRDEQAAIRGAAQVVVNGAASPDLLGAAAAAYKWSVDVALCGLPVHSGEWCIVVPRELRHVKHSFTPNCCFALDVLRGVIALIALRELMPHEEPTVAWVDLRLGRRAQLETLQLRGITVTSSDSVADVTRAFQCDHCGDGYAMPGVETWRCCGTFFARGSLLTEGSALDGPWGCGRLQPADVASRYEAIERLGTVNETVPGLAVDIALLRGVSMASSHHLMMRAVSAQVAKALVLGHYAESAVLLTTTIGVAAHVWGPSQQRWIEQPDEWESQAAARHERPVLEEHEIEPVKTCNDRAVAVALECERERKLRLGTLPSDANIFVVKQLVHLCIMVEAARRVEAAEKAEYVISTTRSRLPLFLCADEVLAMARQAVADLKSPWHKAVWAQVVDAAAGAVADSQCDGGTLIALWSTAFGAQLA